LVSCFSLSKSGTKLAKPAYGCVAVKTRIGGGHVCFVVGKDKATVSLFA
jgi:alpha-D-ribose 1-methylphosphonate 5-triphosphate synthase subunit PhnG